MGTKGLGSALLYLKLNGYSLNDDLQSIKLGGKIVPPTQESNNEILIEFILGIASGKYTLEDVQEWFKHNIVKRNP